ncbi:Putative ribonuclease H protein At1g65750 [Linum perenne]
MKVRESGSLISWTKPPFGWVKLNIDGSYVEETDSMAIGGVIRDAEGNWVTGYTNYLGRGSALQAELVALRDGLSLSWVLGFRKIQVESDCLDVVEIVAATDIQDHPQAVLGTAIKELLSRSWSCTLSHVFREANKVADLLARSSHEDERGERWLLEAPNLVAQAIEEDKEGVLFRRD